MVRSPAESGTLGVQPEEGDRLRDWRSPRREGMFRLSFAWVRLSETFYRVVEDERAERRAKHIREGLLQRDVAGDGCDSLGLVSLIIWGRWEKSFLRG